MSDMDDRRLLEKALSFELAESVEEAFRGMLDKLVSGERRCLSSKQREWVSAEIEKREPSYVNMVSSGLVKPTTKVETIPMLRPENLPRRLPGR